MSPGEILSSAEFNRLFGLFNKKEIITGLGRRSSRGVGGTNWESVIHKKQGTQSMRITDNASGPNPRLWPGPNFPLRPFQDLSIGEWKGLSGVEGPIGGGRAYWGVERLIGGGKAYWGWKRGGDAPHRGGRASEGRNRERTA